MAMLPTNLTPDCGPLLSLVLLYVGPDVFLPLTSALAALGGLILMFWQRLVALFNKIFRRDVDTAASTTPKSKSGDA